MQYTKSSGVGGAWVKGSEVVSGTKCKLVSETAPQPSEFGSQDVAKIRFKGEEGEPKNVRINKPSINALIDAFGDDSKAWIGNILTAVTEKMVVSGKRVTALYLVPEGYSLGEDEGHYLVITKDGGKTETKTSHNAADLVNTPPDELNPEDIPF